MCCNKFWGRWYIYQLKNKAIYCMFLKWNSSKVCVYCEKFSQQMYLVITGVLSGFGPREGKMAIEWNLSIVAIHGPKIFGLIRKVARIKLANLMYCWYSSIFRTSQNWRWPPNSGDTDTKAGFTVCNLVGGGGREYSPCTPHERNSENVVLIFRCV